MKIRFQNNLYMDSMMVRIVDRIGNGRKVAYTFDIKETTYKEGEETPVSHMDIEMWKSFITALKEAMFDAGYLNADGSLQLVINAQEKEIDFLRRLISVSMDKL